MKYRLFAGLLAMIIVSLLTVFPSGLSALAGTVSPAPVAASTATPLATSQLLGRIQGTVVQPRVNVRRSPSTSSAVIGSVRKGDRVQITGRQTGWLQIAFSAGPGGRGWVSAPFVIVDGEQNAAPRTQTRPKATPSAVPAASILAYNDPSFSWQWNGANQMTGVDWYFDIQFYKSSGQDPYHVIPVEPDAARLANGVWTFKQHVSPECGSYWVVQIAKRVDGAYAGWVSPKSNRLDIGGACTVEGDGEPAPTPTPCEGCGG